MPTKFEKKKRSLIHVDQSLASFMEKKLFIPTSNRGKTFIHSKKYISRPSIKVSKI